MNGDEQFLRLEHRLSGPVEELTKRYFSLLPHGLQLGNGIKRNEWRDKVARG